jgi:hypothetical protein
MAQIIADFRSGDSFRIKLQYPTGTDLTGYRFWLTLKASPNDPDPGAMQVVTDAGDILEDDPENGTVYIDVSPEASAIPAGKYFWDIQAKSPAGVIVTVAPPPGDYKQRVTCVPGITGATA